MGEIICKLGMELIHLLSHAPRRENQSCRVAVCNEADGSSSPTFWVHSFCWSDFNGLNVSYILICFSMKWKFSLGAVWTDLLLCRYRIKHFFNLNQNILNESVCSGAHCGCSCVVYCWLRFPLRGSDVCLSAVLLVSVQILSRLVLGSLTWNAAFGNWLVSLKKWLTPTSHADIVCSLEEIHSDCL